MSYSKKRMLIIELNEFCPKFLAEVSEKLDLKYLKELLSYKHSTTTTEEKKEFQGLDPWVQWVSIHNGIPMEKHGVKRLGLSSKNKSKNIWNKLSQNKNIKWIVMGVMNSSKGNSKGCVSFFPDPWSSKEKAYPKELNNLLSLPRYVSKNYLSLNFLTVLKKSLKAIKFFLRIENLDLTKNLFLKFIVSLRKPGINIHTLTTLFDYLLVLYFSRIKSKEDPELSIIFLNHIAHLQHHFWYETPYIHPQMEHGLNICNEIIKILLSSAKNSEEKILIINGFKQELSSKNGIQVYRQINPKKVLEELNIKNVKIEQNMTNDGKLIFKEKSDANKAFEILSKCQLKTGERLFFVEKFSELEIFIQLDLNHAISKDALIISGNKVISFYDLFTNLNRTGSHIPEGDIFFKNMVFPKKIDNHRIYDYIFNSF